MVEQTSQSIALKTLLEDNTKEAELYETQEDGRLLCYACGHECKIPEGRPGVCRVRYNDNGILKCPTGYIGALQVDPIEKKPFFHAMVGQLVMSFGMLGCDMHCAFCQNWVTSQALRDPKALSNIRQCNPADLVNLARQHNAPVIASTYNEPLITAEWAHEVFAHAHEQNYIGAFISNGNATERVLQYLRPYTQIYNVDLKTFQDKQYRKLGGQLDHVLRTIKQLHAMGFWIEIVTLVVPGMNDSKSELEDIAHFVSSVSNDIPLHYTGFHADYKMNDTPTTQVEQLTSACEAAERVGLNFVYAGNRPGMVGEWENTRCPSCKSTVITRKGYHILDYRLVRGWCPDCGTRVPGFWNRDCVVPAQGAGQSAWLEKHPSAKA